MSSATFFGFLAVVFFGFLAFMTFTAAFMALIAVFIAFFFDDVLAFLFIGGVGGGAATDFGLHTMLPRWVAAAFDWGAFFWPFDPFDIAVRESLARSDGGQPRLDHLDGATCGG